MLCILFIAGCVQKNQEENQEEIRKILISGIDKTEEISSDVPVDLVVSGVRNQITVLEGTEINSITISGIDTQIKYYTSRLPNAEEKQEETGEIEDIMFEICKENFNQKYNELQELYAREIGGRSFSSEESVNAFTKYNRKFNEIVEVMNDECMIPIEDEQFLQFIEDVYQSQSEFLYNWYIALSLQGFKLTCKTGDVLGRDTICHSSCGTSYCPPRTYCQDNKCFSP